MPLQGDYAPSPAKWARDQVEEFEASNGARGNTMQGKPIIVLTTLGASTGKIRKTPLMRVELDGEYLVVGSKGGSATDPKWVANVRSHPLVELQDGSDRADYDARELAGPERHAWWERAVATFPPYAGYQKQTARLIPVFLLTRRGG